jgi:hypothetical protein
MLYMKPSHQIIIIESCNCFYFLIKKRATRKAVGVIDASPIEKPSIKSIAI